MRVPACGREDDISSSLSACQHQYRFDWVLSVACVTVVYSLQSHYDSQAMGNSGIVELREGFSLLRSVQY